MTRKTIPIASVVIISFLGILFLVGSSSFDKEALEKTFFVDAIYFEDEGYVEITFQDKSQKTTKAVLEVLGMSNSFQKIFSASYFTERVPFSSPPQYGWKTNPVTLLIEHEEFGQVGIKTEIHDADEPAKPIIFSNL